MDRDRLNDLELSRVRAEIRDLEIRLMGPIVRLHWMWVIAIHLASLAIAATFIVAIAKHR